MHEMTAVGLFYIAGGAFIFGVAVGAIMGAFLEKTIGS